MGRTARWEYFREIFRRYREASGAAKGRILDESCCRSFWQACIRSPLRSDLSSLTQRTRHRKTRCRLLSR